MKKPISIGDRVRVYSLTGTYDTEVIKVASYIVTVTNNIKYHIKQCRKLKPKPIAREFWIKCVPNKEYDLIGIVDALDEKRYPHTIKVREVIP